MNLDQSQAKPLESHPLESEHARDFVVARILVGASGRTEAEVFDSAKQVLDHAQGCAEILVELHADPAAISAAWLFGHSELIPLPVIDKEFGSEVSQIVDSMRKLRRLRELSLSPSEPGQADSRHDRTAQARLETLRRMLLAMSVDVRVVLLRLASRLQTLRRHAAERTEPTHQVCLETLQVLAPLANRLGIGSLKWQLEDLAFRFLEPDLYKSLAQNVQRKRSEREILVRRSIAVLQTALIENQIEASISGRPKHLYSIASKMRKKSLSLEQVHDLHALRVIVADIPACYRVLDTVHSCWTALIDHYSDYISAPKSNGYQSLHTIVTDSTGVILEVQIRTEAMDEAAEYGGAAHWQYKEGLAAASGVGHGFEQRVAWLRQLLVWQRDIGHALGATTASGQPDSTIYAMTPQGRVIALPAGATPVDFAYHLHTELGHRCRGAKVNGVMVPLTRVLETGETVEIVVAKGQDASAAGPSRDWANQQRGFLVSHRARGKVRQWFAAQESAREQQAGRAIIDRAIAHEAAGSVSLDRLAERLNCDSSSHLSTLAFKGEIGPRAIEQALRELKNSTDVSAHPPVAIVPAVVVAQPKTSGRSSSGSDSGVLIEGVSSLLTQLARCCRPVPPDEIAGFITRGKGVTVHRKSCQVFESLFQRAAERTVSAAWADMPEGVESAENEARLTAKPTGAGARGQTKRYPVELEIKGGAADEMMQRVAEVLAREQVPMLASNTTQRGESSLLRITIALESATGLPALLSRLLQIPDVAQARRR